MVKPGLSYLAALFAGLMLAQVLAYYLDALGRWPAVLEPLWCLLLPGYSIFLFLPFSTEMLSWHPWLLVIPITVNASIYLAAAVSIWESAKRLQSRYSCR